MKFNPASRWIILVSLLTMMLHPVGAPPVRAESTDVWWHDDWPYRIAVTVDGAGGAAVNLDFSSIFSELGLNHALLDLRSVRVIPYQGGVPGLPVVYGETYSTLFIDAETLNTSSEYSESYWFGQADTTLSLESERHTQGDRSIHAHIRIDDESIARTGFDYYFNGLGEQDWSSYESLLYDVWPQVNASAVDQTPDLFYFNLEGLTGCPSDFVNGPALAMDTWNHVNVSLKPFGSCLVPGLSNLEFLRFFVKVNRYWDDKGYFDPGDEVQFWLDNFRLVDQDGSGKISWVSEAGVERYYIYFDTLNHEGHPQPDLIAPVDATIGATLGGPEAGGYFHQISGANTDSLAVWTAPITEKITQSHATPMINKPLMIQAARGEFEPIQLVVRSPIARSLKVSASPLLHENGQASIPANQVKLFRVDYVDFTRLSDFYGRTGPWPDPLYPVTMGSVIEFQENKNQPLWFRVEVPYGATAGIYSGAITIGSAVIPFSLRVWDFSLPIVNPLDSKFGFDWDAVLEVYGGTLNGNPQACYQNLVEAINETFADYRLNPLPPDSPDMPDDVLIYSLTAYEVNKAHYQQVQLGKRVWWELSAYDQPPLVNPAVIDRPGWDARMLPWLAWLDRVDGIYYKETADWSFDPWTTPFAGVNNGEGFMFYPPKDETVGFDPCNAESNRLIPSIRLELLREGLEDYVYLWMLNMGKPVIDEENQSDVWASTIIDSRTSFSRIPTALNPIRIGIAELLELRQYAVFLPLVIR